MLGLYLATGMTKPNPAHIKLLSRAKRNGETLLGYKEPEVICPSYKFPALWRTEKWSLLAKALVVEPKRDKKTAILLRLLNRKPKMKWPSAVICS